MGKHTTEDHAPTATGPSPSTARYPTRFAYDMALSLPPGPSEPGKLRPTTPYAQPPTGITRARFGLLRFRSPLLTEYPFLQVLRCFTSLRTPQPKLVPAHQGRWVPPFGDPRIKARSAAPRGISLPATSFIGPVCQGIHPTPLQATRKTKKQSFKVTATTLREYTRRHIITSEMITKRPKRNTTRVFRIEITTKKTKQKTSFDSRSRPLSSSQTTTTPTAPATGTQSHDREPPGTGKPTPQKGAWRSGNPKACPYHSPPKKDEAHDLFHTSTPNTGNHSRHRAHDSPRTGA